MSFENLTAENVSLFAEIVNEAELEEIEHEDVGTVQ
jgi:hypothetical protein